jgi:hypothetical protein
MTISRTLVLSLAAMCGLSFAAARPAQAVDTVLNSVADAFISSDPDAVKENFGAAPILVGSADPEYGCRILLRFDLSPLKSETIRSARLRLWSTDWVGDFYNPSATYVHALSQPWEEGEVSWMYASYSMPWKAAGGDIAPCKATQSYFAANRNGLFIPAGESRMMEWDVTALVQKWMSGKIANNGVMITNDDAFFAFQPRETYFPGLEPVLIIDNGE